MRQWNSLQNPKKVDTRILCRSHKQCINFSHVNNACTKRCIHFFQQPIGCKDNLVRNIDPDNKTSTDNNDSDTIGSYVFSLSYCIIYQQLPSADSYGDIQQPPLRVTGDSEMNFIPKILLALLTLKKCSAGRQLP